MFLFLKILMSLMTVTKNILYFMTAKKKKILSYIYDREKKNWAIVIWPRKKKFYHYMTAKKKILPLSGANKAFDLSKEFVWSTKKCLTGPKSCLTSLKKSFDWSKKLVVQKTRLISPKKSLTLVEKFSRRFSSDWWKCLFLRNVFLDFDEMFVSEKCFSSRTYGNVYFWNVFFSLLMEIFVSSCFLSDFDKYLFLRNVFWTLMKMFVLRNVFFSDFDEDVRFWKCFFFDFDGIKRFENVFPGLYQIVFFSDFDGESGGKMLDLQDYRTWKLISQDSIYKNPKEKILRNLFREKKLPKKWISGHVPKKIMDQVVAEYEIWSIGKETKRETIFWKNRHKKVKHSW